MSGPPLVSALVAAAGPRLTAEQVLAGAGPEGQLVVQPSDQVLAPNKTRRERRNDGILSISVLHSGSPMGARILFVACAGRHRAAAAVSRRLAGRRSDAPFPGTQTR